MMKEISVEDILAEDWDTMQSQRLIPIKPLSEDLSPVHVEDRQKFRDEYEAVLKKELRVIDSLSNPRIDNPGKLCLKLALSVYNAFMYGSNDVFLRQKQESVRLELIALSNTEMVLNKTIQETSSEPNFIREAFPAFFDKPPLYSEKKDIEMIHKAKKALSKVYDNLQQRFK